MTASCPLPEQSEVKEFLANLLGKPIAIERGTPVVLTPRKPSVVSVYQLDDGSVGALTVCDIEFAAGSGAALALIPTQVVKESIEQSKIPDNILENFKEIMNIFTGVFNKPDCPHVALSGIHIAPPALPRNVIEVIAQPSRRLDSTIMIVGYGGGKLSLLTRG
jgi:hypothetical protein